jgi:hypothetical protein
VDAFRARTPLAGLATFDRAVSSSGKMLHPLCFQTGFSNLNRPASGFRAQKEFPYSSQPARSARKL